MALFEITLAIILLAICYLISYSFSYDGAKITPVSRIESKGEYPIIVIIGATSSRGQNVLKLFENKKVNLIVISRRETRWLKIKERFPNVMWYRGDIRLSHEMNEVFSNIKRSYGSIDIIINLSNISGQIDKYGVSSIRVKDSVFCKLDQAYDPELLAHKHVEGSSGEENPLFTNIIGHLIVKEIAIRYNCNKVITVLGNDSVVNELITKIERESSGRTKFISLLPDKLDKIKDIISLD